MVLFGPPTAVEGSYKVGSACQSCRLSFRVCRRFLGTGSFFFLRLCKKFCLINGKNREKMGQRFLEVIKKFRHLFFLNLVYTEILFAIYLHKFHISEKNWFLRYGPNCQSDCWIFKSTIYLELNDKIAWFLQMMEIKSWWKKWIRVVINGCGPSGDRNV